MVVGGSVLLPYMLFVCIYRFGNLKKIFRVKLTGHNFFSEAPCTEFFFFFGNPPNEFFKF